MKSFSLLPAAFLFSVLLVSAQPGKRKDHFNLQSNGLALAGYDAVSYFSESKAREGDKRYSVSHDGVLYYFSSEANKKKFLANPSAFEPQYGGWCAYAMGSSGEKVDVDPETFKIVDGKLYLFYNRFFNNTLKSWNKNESSLKLKADENWSKICR